MNPALSYDDVILCHVRRFGTTEKEYTEKRSCEVLSSSHVPPRSPQRSSSDVQEASTQASPEKARFDRSTLGAILTCLCCRSRGCHEGHLCIRSTECKLPQLPALQLLRCGVCLLTQASVGMYTLIVHVESSGSLFGTGFYKLLNKLPSLLPIWPQADELSFEEGDTLYILEKVQWLWQPPSLSVCVCTLAQNEDGWWKAKCGRKEGLIPSNYSEQCRHS